MSSVNKTVNYGLSQFGDADKPSWRGDYTGDMVGNVANSAGNTAI